VARERTAPGSGWAKGTAVTRNALGEGGGHGWQPGEDLGISGERQEGPSYHWEETVVEVDHT
jgi:hypothetical protein